MIIDLTVSLSALHDMWDVVGIILGGLIIVFMPIALVLASTIKIKEYVKSKLEKGA